MPRTSDVKLEGKRSRREGGREGGEKGGRKEGRKEGKFFAFITEIAQDFNP